MNTVTLTLGEIEELVTRVFTQNGCDAANTAALVRTVVTAERDGSLSHGLFRVPGYVASLRSGKVKGIRFRTLAKLCAVLQCTPGDLLDYASDPADLTATDEEPL